MSSYKIFNLTENSQIEVSKIVVVGNDRTKLDYFQHELNNQLHSVYSTRTAPNSFRLPFSILHSNLNTFTNRLISTDLFEACDTNIQIDTFKAEENKYEATVKITVREKGIPFLRTQSYVRAGKESEIGAEFTGALRNPLGYGDNWKLSTIAKHQGSREFAASIVFPHISNTPNDIAVSVPTQSHQVPSVWDVAPACPLSINAKSCIENAPGLGPYKLSSNSFSIEYNYPNNKHVWALEYSIRDEIPFLTKSIVPRNESISEDGGSKSIPTHSLWKDMIPQSTLWVSSPFSISEKAAPNEINGENSSHHGLKNTKENENIHPLFLNMLSSSIKSSLSYRFTPFDTRNSVSFPTEGAFLQSQVELATHPGNTHFLKTEVTSQYHRTFYPFGLRKSEQLPDTGITLSLAGNIGLMIPVAYYVTSLWRNLFDHEKITVSTASADNDLHHHHDAFVLPKPSYISDRFYLGGPLSLRGFDIHGVGSRASHTIHHHHNHQSNGQISNYDNRGLSLGGDSRSAFLAMIAVPFPVSWSKAIPILQSLQLRSLYFFNIGTLGNSDYWSWQHLHPTTKQLIANRLPNSHHHAHSNHHVSNSRHVQGLISSSLFGHMRASVGTGISCNLGSSIRLEATYSIPFLYNSHDVLHPFQFGIGMSIM